MAKATSRASLASLGLILVFGCALRFRAANHPYISQWDEAYHALVAKNMAAARSFTPVLYAEKVLPGDDREWTKAGVWLHKPPLPLWLMSAGIAVFGENELSFRLPAVLLDTLAILLIFLLARELFGPPGGLAGLIAAALYAINPLMIRLVSGRIPDDTPHTVNVFFITCTVLLFAVAARKNSRAYAAAAGLSLGLGTLCMSAVALLGLAAPLPLLFAARGVRGTVRLLAPAVLTFAAAALPWPLYCLNRWPELWRHETALQTKHLFAALEGHSHAWWWYLKILPVQYGGSAALAALSACAALAYAVREAARRKDPGLASALVWLLLPYAFFSAIVTKLYSYTCVAVPALCLLTGFAAAALWAARAGGFRAAATAGLLIFAAQTGLVAVERMRADYSECPWNAAYDYPAFRSAMLTLRGIPGPKVLLNVRDSKTPQAMYYSGAVAYGEPPSVPIVRGLLARGYRVFVLIEESRRGETSREFGATEFRRKIIFIPLPAPLAGDVVHPYEA